MLELPARAHNNQQLFSDHYLDETLPRRHDWQALMIEAEPIKEQIAAIFAQYKPGDKEAQVEDDLIKPILRVLGHTFEVQVSLATPDGTKQPDYIFYRDQDALHANKGLKLTDKLVQAAFAVGDAKYWECPLDVPMKKKTSDPFTNKNPSYQIAFYMQHSGLEWGILTNGRQWRLYQAQTAHKLDHYYEVDLPAVLHSGDADYFLYFYVFFCRAAFDAHALGVAAILQESIDYAKGVSESLKDQVYEALRHVAQGFLDFPPNKLTSDDLTEIYDNSLILLYRLLFILYAEARNLLPINDSNLYCESYSLRSVTRTIERDLRAGRKLRPNSKQLYCATKYICDCINQGDPALNISTFNGGLFDAQHYPFLEHYRVGDERLQQAIDLLARVDGQFIDYRDLSVRNLGTIYEGLLEYHLEQTEAEDSEDGWTIDLRNDKGERKATGSYYTPDYIVKYIVEQTIGPLLQSAVEQTSDEKGKVDAVLAIKVLDPAIGSGHFLVEATEYIARFLVELNIQAPSVLKDADLAYWKRRVVQSCIYGVDVNPLAVELAKLSLWLSTVAKDRPLSFLDHHVRIGNALIGTRLADIATSPNGNGSLRKTKKAEAPREQLSLFDDEAFRQSMTLAVNLMWLVEDNPAQTVAQVKEQEQLYAEMREKLSGKYGRVANLYIAYYYGVPVDTALWKPLVDFATGRTDMGFPQFKEWSEQATTIATQRHFFHWELEFPEIFFDKHGQPKGSNAGFDAVIGNPPWIRQETFSADKPVLKRLFQVYHGVADLYTYFVELGNNHLVPQGRFGFIIPNKFVRASYGLALRNFLREQVRLERLIDFGDLGVFAEAVTYPMIVLTTKHPSTKSQVKYTHLNQLHPGNLSEDITSGEVLLPSALLTSNNWSLSGEMIQAIVEKMKAVATPLGEYVDRKLYRGILTGFNAAFVIDHHTRDQLIAADPKNAEIIKPFIIGKDVKRYRLDYQRRYIILSKIGTPIERYPVVFAHLQQYQTQLENRWDKGKYWWELRACDYYGEFEQPKIIFPNICRQPEFTYDVSGYYSNQKTYIIPKQDKYLLTVLNSHITHFIFHVSMPMLRGGFFEPGYVFMKNIPIRRINFTTSPDERTTLTNQGTAYYNDNQQEELLALVEACLAHEPEQGDVVHDLLVYLAEQMLDLHKQRQEALEDFLLALQSVFTDAELQKIGRLWTPLPVAPTSDINVRKRITEAQEKLGILATQTLDLRDDIGKLNEGQWAWLLKNRISPPELVPPVKVHRKYQPPIAELDTRIASTNRLIDQVVYRLYGLTLEEITIVEDTLK
ncbi:MAG: Eco57I restriction-modification methylase domain-containing protein [Chloroflexi bacterium]|nr:Eco57I restriction-modification methylase domain-containing protein [Chloroflexota bacterium]